MSSDMLEDDLRPHYDLWKNQPGPEANAGILNVLKPTIEGAIRTHVGEPNPLLTSRARLLTLQGLPGYDPKRGRLKSHLYNHLLALKRANRQQTTILKVPERVALDKFNLEKSTDELRAVLGREPSDAQLADHTGFSLARIGKVRGYNSGYSEGSLEDASGGNLFGGVRSMIRPEKSHWQDLVYDQLDEYHRKIMELTLGLHGRRPMSNQAIAAKLQRSPGAISQAKLRIQKLLDEEHELSPFGS
jgi:hypothetical protein